jgi:hypothetical protein
MSIQTSNPFTWTSTVPTSLNAVRGWIKDWASRQADGRPGLSWTEDSDGNCILRIGRSLAGRVAGLNGKQPPPDLKGTELHHWIFENSLGDEWDGLGIKLIKVTSERTQVHIVNAARESAEILPYSRRFLSDLADTWPECSAAPAKDLQRPVEGRSNHPASDPTSAHEKRRGRPRVFESSDQFEKMLRTALETLKVQGDPTDGQAVADYWVEYHPYYRKRRRDGKGTSCAAEQVYDWCKKYTGTSFEDFSRRLPNR